MPGVRKEASGTSRGLFCERLTSSEAKNLLALADVAQLVPGDVLDKGEAPAVLNIAAQALVLLLQLGEALGIYGLLLLCALKLAVHIVDLNPKSHQQQRQNQGRQPTAGTLSLGGLGLRRPAGTSLS